MQGARRFRNCFEACAETEGCIDVSFQGDVCYLRNLLGTKVFSANMWGARMLTTR
jgi:hypothetical protein